MGDQHAWQMISHVSALIQFIGIPSFVGPLIVWFIKRDDPLVRPHAREALNFQLSLIIYFIVGIIVAIIAAITVVGLAVTVMIFLFLGVLLIAEVVFAILATVAASKHQLYRYPMSLNLIK